MSSTRRPIPWNKVLAVALLLLLVGYLVARPTLERWWGIELPSLVESGPPAAAGPGPAADRGVLPGRIEFEPEQREATGSKSKPDSSELAATESTTVGSSRPPTTGSEKGSSKKELETAKAKPAWALKPIDRGRFLSPAGLIYARGPQGEHRVDHVLRHAEDSPGRPDHGVFIGSREEILQLLDEAYLLIQQNSKRVSKQTEGDRTEYTIRFDRPIGYQGGRNGKRNNFPKVNRLRLVLEDEKSVVTAYPVR